MTNDTGQEISLASSSIERDLGVTIDKDLSFEKHIQTIVKKANQITGLMWRSFEYIDEKTFNLLYKSMIRSHLEYASSVWSPHLWRLAELIESVQRRATKRVPNVKDLDYESRLRKLKLLTLVYRQLRGDLINTYKYIHEYYNTESVLPQTTDNERTRGHKYRLKRITAKNNARRFFFSNRVVCWWNSLPDEVVEAPNIISFKAKFDYYFKDHPVLYNYKALDHPQRPQMTIH